MPDYLSTLHPLTSLVHIQSLSPPCSFLTLTESLDLSFRKVNIHLSSWKVLLNTWWWSSIPPFTNLMMPSIEHSIWVMISSVCSGPTPVFRIVVMSLYGGIVRGVSIREVATSDGISEKSQNYFEGSTQTIRRTSSMQIMIIMSVITYVMA